MAENLSENPSENVNAFPKETLSFGQVKSSALDEDEDEDEVCLMFLNKLKRLKIDIKFQIIM
jgi:hypothetical protein